MAARRFDVVAVWRDQSTLPIFIRVQRHPYTPHTISTVAWVKNVTLWALGGLVNVNEPYMHTVEAEAHVFVSASMLPDAAPLVSDIPPSMKIVYVHLPNTIKKPLRTPTEWNLNRGDKEVSVAIKTRVKARSGLCCVLSNERARGVLKTSDTHQVAHIIAKHCSPTAMCQFSQALQDLGLPFHEMEDLAHEANLSFIMKHLPV
ncbi:hypothetical protein B0H17DRAFT_424250 [Mycena rosella]|uniref:Uncharacterized protein n=1 Tax=Mycena rosella TaxID=1033263 RepID=A0AAD7DNV5_MYCRO|nr:hypothetical protein B0H17DRAFT_424250 [Mycena rosella]